MKASAKTLFLTIAFTLFISASGLAQDQVASISKLEEQIQQMEIIDRDPNTPIDVKNINRGFLGERRLELRAALQKRISSLRDYRTKFQGALKPNENQVIEESIRTLENKLRGLEERMGEPARVVAAAPPPRQQEASTSHSIQPTTYVKSSAATDISSIPVSESIPVQTTTPQLEVTAFKEYTTEDAQIQITNNDANITNVLIQVGSKDPIIKEIAIPTTATSRTINVPVKLVMGDNRVNVQGRNSDNLLKFELIPPLTIKRSAPVAPVAPATASNKIQIGASPTTTQKTTTITATINDPTISSFQIFVLDSTGKEVDKSDKIDVIVGKTAYPVTILLAEGENKIKAVGYDIKKAAIFTTPEAGYFAISKLAEEDVAATEKVAAKSGNTPTPFTRAILGLEQAGGSSANPTQKLFFEFFLDVPLFRSRKRDGSPISPIQAPFFLWLNPRITSLPKTIATSAGDFALASNFFSPFLSGKVNELTQAFGFLGGFEIPFKHNKSRVTAPIASGFGKGTRARFSLSFIGAVGAITPLSSETQAQVFKVNQTVIDRFPEAQGKEFIAFVNPERSRFFRQYYGGLRIKTYFVKADALEEMENIFPGIIDITFGQNESVTRGALRGGVVRLDGIYPIPFGDTAKGFIYAFGSVHMKLSKAQTNSTVILQPPDAVVPVPGSNVFIQPLDIGDRDYYRIGVGVDLARLLRFRSENPPAASTPK